MVTPADPSRGVHWGGNNAIVGCGTAVPPPPPANVHLSQHCAAIVYLPPSSLPSLWALLYPRRGTAGMGSHLAVPWSGVPSAGAQGGSSRAVDLAGPASKVLPPPPPESPRQRPPPGAPGHHAVQAGCASRVRCKGAAHPRKLHRPLRVQVRTGREDRATRPPPRDDTGGNDPCSSGRAGYQASEVQVRGRWIDPSWWQSLKVHPDPWESPDSPSGGSPTPSHFGGAHGPWESSGSPCGVTPSRCTRPLGVV